MEKYGMPTFMILPSMACQASCKYCFGPHKGAIMSEETARETVRFMEAVSGETGTDEISVIFHGGEPLLAPLTLWKVLLEELSRTFCGVPLRMSVQSNLWNLTEEHLALFKQYHVRIGTSLDGPKELCDLNRGEGYFEKTFASVRKAQVAGKTVSAIATITKQTLPYAKEILSFFRDQGMPPVLHAAVAAMGKEDDPLALTPQQYANLMTELFPWYVSQRKEMRNETLDRFVQGIVLGNPGVCTFKDCLGMFLAISPEGDIFSCQRLAGKKEFVLGNIFERPTLEKLLQSPAGMKQRARQERVKAACGKCGFYEICKGGCYYNALSSGGDIDPLCEGYKKGYKFVQGQLVGEMAMEENRAELMRHPIAEGKHPLLRKGAYTSLAYNPHPSEIADNARTILAIHALGKYPDTKTAAEQLYRKKICGNPESTQKALDAMKANMPVNRAKRNNCYLHVTFSCNLRCTHCYASAGEQMGEMPIEAIEKLTDEAIAGGFRQVVFTGGEPMVHSERRRFIEACGKRRGKGANLVLRTNLYSAISEDELLALSESFDQVVVSLDGNEETHDARRGKGSYSSTKTNCERYAALTAGKMGAGELSLACVMRAEEINGEPGESLRALGRELNVRRVRFRPLLPLGRAQSMKEPVMCEGLMEHETPEERLSVPAHPLITCGIGQNLFIQPDGSCYPCYAWCHKGVKLGNALETSMEEVMRGEGFRSLLACTVDTMEKCRECEYRYLCGGACRAWGNTKSLNVNAAPPDCSHLMKRAEALVQAARLYLED